MGRDLKNFPNDKAFLILKEYLNTKIERNNIPILVWDIKNKCLILYKNINEIKLKLKLNLDINNYLFQSENKYKDSYQFIYLVDYYWYELYKNENLINLKVIIKLI